MAVSDIAASIIAHIIIIPYMWQGHLRSEVQNSFLKEKHALTIRCKQ